MKIVPKAMKRLAGVVLFAGFLAMMAPARLQAQQNSGNTAAQQARQRAAADNHMDAPESDATIQQYRHSAVVQQIARMLHVSTETAALIFEDFNSAVLLIAIFGFLWKAVPKMFRQRSERLSKQLAEAHAVTEQANRRLAEVEAKLAKLDSEIDAIRQQVEKEAQEDERRIRASLEAERERIIASAEQEIGAAQSAAQRELKKFAADLAIDQAVRRIRLTAETDRALISEFGAKLGNGGKA